MSKHNKVEDLNFLKIQTCVLKVNIHCEGCKKKVKKLLQKIDGVYTISIDAEQGKVTVNGNLNPSTLIKKLNKAGKHAELWSAKKSAKGNIELHGHLPKFATDTAKGQQKPPKNAEGKEQFQGKDQKLQQLQKELKDMNFQFSKGEKSAKLPVFEQELDDGSEFDDEFDEDDDYFDESDGSFDDFDDDNNDVKATNAAAPKKIATEKQEGGGEVHGKSNGGGGAHGSINSGVRQGKGSGGNVAGGKNDAKSHGLSGIPTAGGVQNGFFNRATPAAAPPGGSGYAYQQQQNMADMMQQQRMMMMNGYPIPYGYPIPRSESYASYFSDENTGGGCRIM